MMSQRKTPRVLYSLAFHLKRPFKSCKLKFERSFQVKYPHRSVSDSFLMEKLNDESKNKTWSI